MPYHNHIYPARFLETLSHMATQWARGEAVFYEIYAEADKHRAPDKCYTGIFMSRGRDNAPFAMIAPGGGFACVGSLHEGVPIARRVAIQDYNAFVMKYRVGKDNGEIMAAK